MMHPLAAALVVVISIDQMRYDYLQRFDAYFTTRGFKRFTTIGATYTNARPRHSVTSTGPGHAAIAGGTVPRENGIVANRWLDRTTTFDESKWATYFAETTPWSGGLSARRDETASGGLSARRDKTTSGGLRARRSTFTWYASPYSPLFASDGALTPTLGDDLKREDPQSRVVALALTDRAAILMGGKSADAIYWFDHRQGGFVPQTSFNALIPGYIPGSAQWTPMMPREELERITFDPPAAWPLKNSLYGATFPHPIASIRALQSTPFAHAMLFDFAQQLIADHHLGEDDHPDILWISISSTDYLGHLYGPDSMEVADSMVRLDRALGDFLDALDHQFGGDVIVALTSDHGIQSIPEIAKLRDANADVGRIDLRVPQPDAKTIRELPPLRIELERKLARALKLPFSLDAPLQNALVFFFEEPTLSLNDARIAALRLDPKRVARALRDAVREIDGVANAWTYDDPELPLLVKNALHPTRSGDVVLTLKPGWIWMWGSNSTTHGQPVEADLHVPLMLYGPGIARGVHDEEVAPMDLAKTLGAMLGIEAGGRQSKLLRHGGASAAVNTAKQP